MTTHGQTAPPAIEAEFTGVVSGTARLDDSGGNKYSGNAQSAIASCLVRRSLAEKDWYFDLGVRAEDYRFSHGVGSLRHLQDYAAVLAVEYYAGEEPAAALTLRPGWYFGTHATASSWDVPVELTSGLPLARGLDGVWGFSNARFYHHAVPVLGVAWTLSPRLRIEAIYPEPAVVWTINRTTSLRFGGELTGGGFLVETTGGKTAVEYSSYKVGAELSGEWRRGITYAVATGYEAVRTFDFFRRQGAVKGSGSAYFKFRLIFAHRP